MTLLRSDIHRIITLVDVITMVTVATETKRAVACEVTVRVGARRVRVAIVRVDCTFVYILTKCSVPLIS